MAEFSTAKKQSYRGSSGYQGRIGYYYTNLFFPTHKITAPNKPSLLLFLVSSSVPGRLNPPVWMGNDLGLSVLGIRDVKSVDLSLGELFWEF